MDNVQEVGDIKHALKRVDNKQILKKEDWGQNLEWDLGDCTGLQHTDFYFFPTG